MMIMTTAIIIAGGSGIRMGESIPEAVYKSPRQACHDVYTRRFSESPTD